MDQSPSFPSRFFGVITKGQTYLNTLYLLLAFPLGIIYFIFLVVGLSVGIPLIILFVGLFILMGVFAGAWILTVFERQLAIWLLRVDIPPMGRPLPSEASVWERFKAYVTNPVTWKGLLYLFLKFPIGIASFTVTFTLLVLSLVLLTAPLTYSWLPINVWFWRIDNLPKALIASVVGLVLTFTSLHVFNFFGDLLGRFARLMLGVWEPGSVSPPSAAPEIKAPPMVPEQEEIEATETE